MKKIILGILTLSTLASCNPKTAEVATASQTTKGDSKAVKEEPVAMTAFPNGEIAEGSSLYNAHCGKCHELPVVSRYSKEKWQKIVPAMCKEAKLDATQESRIASYVNWKLQQQ